MNERVLVCSVEGQAYYGTEMEVIAAKLKAGDVVVFKGSRELVDYVWFYDGPIVKLKSGKSIHPNCGDTFEVVKAEGAGDCSVRCRTNSADFWRL